MVIWCLELLCNAVHQLHFCWTYLHSSMTKQICPVISFTETQVDFHILLMYDKCKAYRLPYLCPL